VQYPPHGVGGERASVFSGGDLSEQVRDGPLEPGQRFVSWRQDTVGDEHSAQIIDRPTVRVGVEGFVGQRDVTARERGQDRSASSLA
jgi:hypothetical protein